MVYCKNLSVRRLKINFATADILGLSFKASGCNLSLLVIYRWHQFAKDYFFYELQDNVENNNALSEKINDSIKWDLNIDLLSDNETTDRLKLCIASTGYASVMNEPTR